VDAASYLAVADDRLSVLPKLLTAWQEVAATGHQPNPETTARLVDLTHAAPESLYRLHLLVTVMRLFARAPTELYESGAIDVVYDLTMALTHEASSEADRVTAELIPMYIDHGRRDMAEYAFSLYQGDAFPILDGLDAFDSSLPDGAEHWLSALAEAVDGAEPHVGLWLLLRLAAVYIRLDQLDQARAHVGRALPMLLAQANPDPDAVALAGAQLRTMGADDLYATLAERILADGRARILEQPEDATAIRSSVASVDAVKTLVSMGDLDRALELTRALQPFERDGPYERIAAAHAQAGQLDEAVAVLEEAADVAARRTYSIRITTGEPEPTTLHVVRGLVAVGRSDDALSITSAVGDPKTRATLEYGIVLSLLGAGDHQAGALLFEQLEAQQREHTFFHEWYEATGIVVDLLCRAGQWAAAVAFHRAWDDPTYSWERTRQLAGRLVKVGEFDAAHDLLAGTSIHAKIAGLLEIAKLAAEQTRDAALAEAERLVDQIDSRAAQADAYTMIANVRSRHDGPGALRLVHKALEVLADIDIDTTRHGFFPNTTPYPDICAALARAGDPEGALALLHRLPERDYVDRAMSASMLADAAIGSDLDVTTLLYEVADTIPAAGDDTSIHHPRALVLAALARRVRVTNLLDRYQVGQSERLAIATALTNRFDDDHAVDAAWELLGDIHDDLGLGDTLAELIDAFLRQRRPEDALAALARISDPATRAKPAAWCAAYLARNDRPDEARALAGEAGELLVESDRADSTAGVALGLAVLTLYGREELVGSVIDAWARSLFLGDIIRLLPMLAWLIDETPTLAEPLADSCTWARSFIDTADGQAAF
jgi:hypothetical protein